MKCPKCASENTQRLEVIFNGGTQTSTSSSVSIGAAMRGGGFGAFTSSSGVSQTTLAQNVAPPQAPQKPITIVGIVIMSILNFFCIVYIVGAITNSWMNLSLSLIICLALTGAITHYLINLRNKRRNYKNNIFPVLYQEWMDSWFCHKCGTTYHQS